MKKESSVSLKSSILLCMICIVIGLFLISCLNVNLVSAADPELKDYNNDDVKDDGDIAFYFGMNIDDFTSKSHKLQNIILDNPKMIENFIAGYFDSIAPGTPNAEKNSEKFYDLFIGRKVDRTFLIDDKLKNKLWQELVERLENPSKFFKEMANKLFRETYENFEIEGEGIEEVDLKNPEKLIWKGDKVGLMVDGKLKSWINLEEPSFWLKKISFDGAEEKFTLTFDNGRGLKEVGFTGGTIGPMGELIGPDGKTVGVRMDEGIKSINFDNANKRFLINYNVLGEDKIIALNQKDLPAEVNQNLQKLLDNPLAGDKIKEILSDLDGLGPDFLKGTKGGFPVQNMINVLYGGDEKATEKININYNENGNPRVDASYGGTIVSTDSVGKVLVSYRQFYSENGIVSKSEVSDGEKPGTLLFRSDGSIEAAKNARIDVIGFGKTYTSIADFVGVDIIRNTFVDAILRGDTKKVMESVFKKGYSVLDDVFNIEKLKRTHQPLKRINLEKVQKDFLNILHSELDNPDLAIEYKSEINRIIDTLVNNIEESGENLAEYALFRNQDSLTPQEVKIREDLVKVGRGQVEGAMKELLSRPEEIKRIAQTQDKDAANQIIRDFLQKQVSSNTFNSFVDNSLTQQIRDLAERVNAPNIDQLSPDALRSKANQAIAQTDFYSIVEQGMREAMSGNTRSATENIRQQIDNLPGVDHPKTGLNTEQRNGIAEVLGSIVTEASEEVKKQQAITQREIISGLKEKKSEYSASITIDTYLNEVYAKGNRYIVFDAKSPLSEFKAESTRTSSNKEGAIIYLRSNGVDVARFDGDKTKTSRIARGSNFLDIDRIVNVQDSRIDKHMKLDRRGWNGHVLYYPEHLVSKSYLATAGLIRANPGVGARITKPAGQFRGTGDIGANPGSRVSLYDATDGITGIFGGRIKKAIAFSKLPSGFIAGTIGEKAAPQYVEFYQNAMKTVGGEQLYGEQLAKANQWYSDIQSTGAEIPLVVSDQLYVANNPDSVSAMFEFMKDSSSGNKNNDLVLTPTTIQVNERVTSRYSYNGREYDLGPPIRDFMRLFDVIANHPTMSPFRHYSLKELQSGAL